MNVTVMLVGLAFFPLISYCIPVAKDGGQNATTNEKTDIEQKNIELESESDRTKPNPEELGDYLEGDIVLPREMDRSGLMAPKYQWPDGVIPYVIGGNFSVNHTELINKAIQLYNKYTCIRKKLPEDNDYVTFSSFSNGCWSYIGRQGGNQTINLSIPDCVRKLGTVAHEMMHVAGFVHEITRYDRDDYVNINWDNVEEVHKHNFQKQREGEIDNYGVSYDYNSVMHYSRFAFTINSKVPAVIPKDSSKAKNIGQRLGFSIKDITEINQKYGCSNKTQIVWDEYHAKKPEIPDHEYIIM